MPIITNVPECRFILQIVSSTSGFIIERFDSKDIKNRDILFSNLSLTAVDNFFFRVIQNIVEHSPKYFELSHAQMGSDTNIYRLVKRVEFVTIAMPRWEN